MPAVSLTFPDQVALPPAACTIHRPGLSVPYGVTLAKARLLASVALPVRTVTWCSFSDAWMTRTIDLPWGVVSRSFSAWSRRPLAGPIAATV